MIIKICENQEFLRNQENGISVTVTPLVIQTEGKTERMNGQLYPDYHFSVRRCWRIVSVNGFKHEGTCLGTIH